MSDGDRGAELQRRRVALGTLLARRRRDRRKSQVVLAAALLCDRSTLSRAENHGAIPEDRRFWERIDTELAAGGELLAGFDALIRFQDGLDDAPPVPAPAEPAVDRLTPATDTTPRPSRADRALPWPVADRWAQAAAPEQGGGEVLRRRLNEALSSTVSTARLEQVEHQVLGHLTDYTRTSPDTALTWLLPELDELQRLAAGRQPIPVHRRLSTAVTMLTLLVADAHMKQGHISTARGWYGTALLAAADADEPRLSALVLAQQTMLAYYYETPRNTVTLARRARAMAGDTVCDAAALAAAAEARALGKLGDARGVHEALDDARRLTEALDDRPTGDDPYAAYRFGPGRLALYTSGALSNLGDTAAARHAQEQALASYAADPDLVVDPALIRLDRALTEASAGDPNGGAGLALTTLTDLHPAHCTPVLLARARDVLTVVAALPGQRGDEDETVRQLRALAAR